MHSKRRTVFSKVHANIIMDTDEKLICLVKRNPCLYDMTSRYYSDKLAKQNAWDYISKEIGIPAVQCVQKWSRIRDNYRKGLKKRQKTVSTRRPLKFEKELAFLKSYIQDHSQSSNIHSAGNIESSQSSEVSRDSKDFDTQCSPHDVQSSNINVQPPSNASSQESINNQPKETVSNLLIKYLESKTDKDPVSMFFLTMAENVKKLPERLQLDVRQKVFSVVFDAELQWLNERDGDDINRGNVNSPQASSCTYQTHTIANNTSSNSNNCFKKEPTDSKTDD